MEYMMKKVIVSCVLFAACSTAMSQGYMGAVLALSKIDGACAGQDDCNSDRHHAFKVYFGSPLAQAHQIDLGVGKVSAVEVGIINFGKGRSAGHTSVPELDANGLVITDNNNVPILTNAPTARSTTAHALTLAAVSTFPIGGGVTGVVRTGAAYVTSTVRYYVQGAENGSETANKLKPYLGLGLEYDVVDNVKIVGAFDWTKFDVAGNTSNLKSFGLGASVGF